MNDKLKHSIATGVVIGLIIGIVLLSGVDAFYFAQGMFNGFWISWVIYKMCVMFAGWDTAAAKQKVEAS